MKILKKIIIAFVLLLLPSYYAAAITGIDMQKELTLNLNCLCGGAPVEGMSFYLYKAADILVDGTFEPAGVFSRFVSEIKASNQKEWQDIAATFSAVALKESVAPELSGKSDENGFLDFTAGSNELACGLYLITSKKLITEEYIYSSEPFLVCLPNKNDQDGSLIYAVSAEPKIAKIENTSKTVNKKVIKIWKDNVERDTLPSEIKVMLYKDDSLCENVSLNEKNGWSYEWKNLSAAYNWRVVEADIDGYEARYSNDGNVSIIENRLKTNKPDNPDKPSHIIPKTGTTMYLVPIFSAAGLMFIALGVIVYRKKIEKK